MSVLRGGVARRPILGRATPFALANNRAFGDFDVHDTPPHQDRASLVAGATRQLQVPRKTDDAHTLAEEHGVFDAVFDERKRNATITSPALIHRRPERERTDRQGRVHPITLKGRSG